MAIEKKMYLGSSLMSFFREHPALLGTFFYLYATLIGLIYSRTLYFHFGISIFDFAEPKDFLLVVFKQPLALVMALPPLVLHVFRQKLWWVSEFISTFGQIVGLGLYVFSVVIYTFFPPAYLATSEAMRILKDEVAHVRLRYLENRSSGEFQTRELTFIGTTGKFSFFYDIKTQNRLVIPIDRVGSISYSSEMDLLPKTQE